jgi:hypothetical protein
MKYTVEVGSDAMIYIPILINIGSGNQKLIGEDTHTQIAWRQHKSYLLLSSK